MIEKMKFLSITGPKADIDRVVNTYLSKYEIHLENALSELTAVESLSPFMEINPYKEALSTANSFYDELADPEKISAKPMDTEQALNTIRRIQSDYQELSNKRADLESQLAALDESLRVIRPFRNINYNISSILKFQFIHFRFFIRLRLRCIGFFLILFQPHRFIGNDDGLPLFQSFDLFILCLYNGLDLIADLIKLDIYFILIITEHGCFKNQFLHVCQ